MNKIKETKESKARREEIVKNILIAFSENCELLGGIKKTPAALLGVWARKIISEVEKN